MEGNMSMENWGGGGGFLPASGTLKKLLLGCGLKQR